MDEEHKEMLRRRRERAAEERSDKQWREQYAEAYVAAVRKVLDKPLTVDSFDPTAVEPFPVTWPHDIRDAEGLIAAYVSRTHASKVLHCFDQKLGLVGGNIGFHDKQYLGLARIIGIYPSSLLEIADETNDTILLYPTSPRGVVLVDYYEAPPFEPFSIVVQGSSLIKHLATCMGENSIGSKR